MSSSSFHIDTGATLVADTSVIINLNRTGRASAIIEAHPGSMVVTRQVFEELIDGGRKGYTDHTDLEALVASGVAKIVDLGANGNCVYRSLVDGPAVETLDDGEAATIAYAYETGAVAILDERKGRTICGNKFSNVAVISTVDLLIHSRVETALGRDGVMNAVIRALRYARMRVLPHQQETILGLIGDEVAATCNSLPG
jgi:predicted nucleic acid-binding protein